RWVSREKLAVFSLSNDGSPPAGKAKASIGYPLIGSDSASERVRLVAMRDNACTASRRLLLPAALGPKSTAIRGNSTATSSSDLNPFTISFFNTHVSSLPYYLSRSYHRSPSMHGFRARIVMTEKDHPQLSFLFVLC